MNTEPTLDWFDAGYDAFPSESATPAPDAGAQTSDWELMKCAIARARRGSRDLVSRLTSDVIGRTNDTRLHRIACEFVSDAGSAADLEALVEMLPRVQFFMGLDIAMALASRGRLVDVPAVFWFHEAYKDHPDADILSADLATVLCEPEDSLPEPANDEEWDEYQAAVAHRYFGLWNQLRTNLVHVYCGRPFCIERVARAILKDVTKGLLDPSDRRLFESTTGLSCSNWYVDERPQFLQIAADIESFLESRKAAKYPPGQRAFMGYPLEDVRAAAPILAKYPPYRGLDVPEIRSILDEDSVFALPFGFDPFHGGYFIQTTRPPPSAELTIDRDWPWLSLHTCLRACISGNREPLQDFATLIDANSDPIFRVAAMELIARAADDRILDRWRTEIRRGTDPAFAFALCRGLLERGILRDVPLVLEAYRRSPNDPGCAYLENRLNYLFAFRPVGDRPESPLGVDACQAIVMKTYDALRRALGRDDVPIFRGTVFSVKAVAREIVELRYGPGISVDLRKRFEASTGIDCSDWEKDEGFDPEKAATTARRFLDSPQADTYREGQLYFFGRPIGQ